MLNRGGRLCSECSRIFHNALKHVLTSPPQKCGLNLDGFRNRGHHRDPVFGGYRTEDDEQDRDLPRE